MTTIPEPCDGAWNRHKALGGRVSKILNCQEVPAPIASMFYQAVLAVILLYKSYSCILPPSGPWVLPGFYVETARRLTGTRPQQWIFWPWIYPKTKDVLRTARIRTIGDNIVRRRHNVAKTTKLRILLEECRGVERKQESQPCQFLWEQVMEP
jgi:hypothetical protein